MSIIRRKRETWTTIPNEILNDERLSLDALGLLVHMLSKPDNWVFSQESMGKRFGRGRDAMRSVMRNLSACGYIRRELLRNEKGQITTITIVSETPDTVQPATGRPEVDNPPLGYPTPLVKTETPVMTEEVKPPLPPTGEVASATPGRQSRKSAKQAVPFEAVMQAYRDALPELSQPDLLTDTRKRTIAARWAEIIGTTDPMGRVRYATSEEGIVWWGRLFAKVRKNPHWMGGNDRGWAADFDWIMGPKNFVKVLEWRPVEGQQ